MAQTDKIHVIGMRIERYIAPMMAVMDYMGFAMPNMGGYRRFPDCFKKELKSAYDYRNLEKFHEKLLSLGIEELNKIDKQDPSLELKLAIAYMNLQPECILKQDKKGNPIEKTKESHHAIHLRSMIELNKRIFEDLGKLEGNIVFYNPISKNITKDEIIDTERFYVPAQFITDPFHLSHRKSYAFLKMANANRVPYQSVIMIPDSIVIIPYKANFDDVPKIVCALPEAVKRTNDHLRDNGKAELPKFEKTLENEQGSSLYELKTWALDTKRLENFIRNEPDDFKEYFDRYGDMDSVLKHVKYEAALKRAVKSRFTAEVISRLDRSKTYVRLWAMKSSQSYDDFKSIMESYPLRGENRGDDIGHSKESNNDDLWLIGGKEGCMRNSDKSPYGELCESSLRILNGYVLSIAGRTWIDENTDILKRSKGKRELQKPLKKKKMEAVKFYSCPGREFSFYLCEYFAQCTDINKSKAFEKDFYCPNNFKNTFSREDFIMLRDHTMRWKWGFSSAASVFYRLLKGENMNILVRSHPIDEDDAKKKGPSYEHSDMVKEFSGKMIFPFIAPKIEIPKRDLRGTDFISSCDIMRLLAKQKDLPVEAKIGVNAIVGTLMHALSNETPKYADGREVDNYGPIRLWKKLGVEPLKNKFFCEIPISYVERKGISSEAIKSGLEEIVVSGRTDEVGALLDEDDSLRDNLNSIIKRLNKEDIELQKIERKDESAVKEKESKIEEIKKEYLRRICEKPFDLIVTDFKCGKKSEKIGYRNQALVYGLGFVQNYADYGIKVDNFYINIVTRPYTKKSAQDNTGQDTLYSGIHRPQVLNLFKVKNSPQDTDVSKLRKEAVRTAELQRKMANDWSVFNEQLAECREKCKCKICFEDVKLRCDRVIREQGKFKNLVEMVESYKKEKEEKENRNNQNKPIKEN